jgi:hypothetical protein
MQPLRRQQPSIVTVIGINERPEVFFRRRACETGR